MSLSTFTPPPFQQSRAVFSRDTATLDVGDVLDLPFIQGREGPLPRRPQRRDLGAAIFGGETITFQKELRGFPFDVARGYCAPPRGRMSRARWSVCARM